MIDKETFLKNSAITKQTRIPVYTIRNWIKNLMQDPNYNPKLSKIKSHLAVSEEFDQIILFIIETEFIDQGFYISTFILRNIVIRCSIEFQDLVLKPNFKASKYWLSIFRQRMGLVLRGFHQPRESEGTNLEEEINDFELTKRQLLEKHRNDQFISRLINMDESKWYEHPIFGLTFGFKGVKNVVFKTYNEKACITIVATITSNGEQRLPLMILLKDSEECKTFAEKFPNIYFVESNKGWTTETGMIKYIKFIVDFYKKNYFSHNQAYFREKENQHIDLIVDKYLSHIGGQKLKQCLVKNNVSIYFVPSDATGRCQPLDVRVFGALKGSASKLYWQEFIFNRNFQLNRTNSIRILEKAWDQLDKKTIADGWKEYERIMKFNNTDNSKIYAQINKLHGDVYERIMNINDQLILKKMNSKLYKHISLNPSEPLNDEMNDEESNSTESIYILDYTKVYIHDEMTQTNKLTLISCEETEHPLWDEFRLIEELVCNSSYKQSKNGRSHICLITEKRGTYINNFAVINSVLQTLSSCFLLRKDLFSENQYLSDEINLIADILNNMEEEKYSVDFSVFKIFTQSISPSLILRNILNPEVFGFDFNVGSQTFSETVSRLKTDETIEDFIKNNNRYNPKAFIIFKLDRYNNDEYTFPMYLEFKDDTFYYYFYLQAVTTKHGESYKTYTRYLCGKKFVSYQKIYLSPNSISDPKLQIQDDYDAKRSQLCLYFCFKSKHNENIEQNHDNSNQDTNANNHNDADEVKDSGDNNDADDNNDEDDSNDEDEGNYSDTDDYNDMDAEINDDINSEIGDERPYNEMNSENATEVNEIQLNDMLNNLPKLHFDHLNRSPCYFSDQELQEILNFLIRNNNVPQQTKILYSAIAKKLQLGYWTIYRWSKKLLQDREYNPKINIRSKQKMTPELESIILFIIQYHYIEEGFYINSFILKNIALRCSIEFEDLMLKDGFTASDQWCRTFRNKFDIVFRAMHANRGCSPDNLSEEEIKKFQALKESLIIQHSEDPYISHLINMDETKWWEHPKFGLTFAFKGAKRVV